MEQDLIAKKELLELAGITYGQLYRWKRKNLIPEEWFIRKSTYTGQETFLPKEQIMSRIEKIQQMKGDTSLDELSEVFSPNLTEKTFSRDHLTKRNIVSNTTMNFFMEQTEDTPTLSFKRMLTVYVLDELLTAGDINLEEGKIVLQVMSEHEPSIEHPKSQLIFIRKLGMSTCFICSTPNDLYFEKEVRVVARFDLGKAIEELKMKLM